MGNICPDSPFQNAPDNGRPVELSILIPAYNEDACIAAVVRETACVLHGLGRSFEIVVVDDGSSDWTPGRLNDLCAEVPEFRALRLATNSGQSAALQAAFRTARGRILLRWTPMARMIPPTSPP